MKHINKSTQCIHNDKFDTKFQNMQMVMSPIYQGSTVLYNDIDAFFNYCRKGINSVEDLAPFPEYGRFGNPTTYEFSKAMDSLEGSDYTLVTNGGMSAIFFSIISFLKSGDHLLVSDGIYSSTRKIIENILPRYNIEYSYYDSLTDGDLESKVKKNTKAIFFEFCASGTFEMEDIDGIVNLAREKNLVTICDNTMMTPFLHNLMDFGIDVVAHSCTKFVIGHSDAMLGTVSVKKKHFKELYDFATISGNHANSNAVYLALRGLKTLGLRVSDSVRRGYVVMNEIANHRMIDRILHPYFNKDEVQQERLAKYTTGDVVGLFSIVLKKKYTNDQLKVFFDELKIVKIGLSWGGFESLCIPYSLAHRVGVAKKFNDQTVMRIYIGMEDEKDVIDDILVALDKLSEL